MSNNKFSALASSYVDNAVQSLAKGPAIGLKDVGFRTKLNTYAELVRRTSKLHPSEAVIKCIAALAKSSTTPTLAVGFAQQLMKQVLWLASQDYYRALNPKAVREVQAWETLDSILNTPEEGPAEDQHPIGCEPENDAPTDDEVRTALSDVNAWLSCIVDKLFADNDDSGREYYRLTDGLEYISKPVESASGVTLYVSIHSVDEALDYQMMQNEEARKNKLKKLVESRQAALDALAEMMKQ